MPSSLSIFCICKHQWLSPDCSSVQSHLSLGCTPTTSYAGSNILEKPVETSAVLQSVVIPSSTLWVLKIACALISYGLPLRRNSWKPIATCDFPGGIRTLLSPPLWIMCPYYVQATFEKQFLRGVHKRVSNET